MAKVLVKVKGVYDMLDVCYKNGWSEDNSTLVVKDKNDLDSSWVIYSKD